MALTMNPMGFYAGDIGASMESEEDRRRRLLAQQQAAVTAQQQAQQATVAPAAPVSPSSMQPVKETRTIDPRTGEVRVKIEGTERDLSAANPMTPTVVQPTVARANQIVQPPQAGQPAQMRQPQVVPTPRPQPPQPMPAAPVSPEMLGQGINLGQPPQPTVGQTLAGARQTLAEMPTAQGVMPQMRRQPQPSTMTPATAAGVAPTAAGGIDWNNILNGSIGSGRVRERVITDPAAPPDVRAAAIANQYNDLTSQRGQREAQQRAQDYIARNDTLGMARELQRDEGSWLKVLLYGALGGKDLARNELNKMGIGGKWVDAYDAQGNRAKIRVRDDGMPMEGFDSQGQPLATQQLAAYSTGGELKGASTSAKRVRDEKGTEWSVVQTTQGPIFFNNQRQRGVPVGRTVDIGIGSDLELQQALQNQKIASSIIVSAAQTLQESKAKYIEQNGPFGTPRNPLSEQQYNSYFAGLFPERLEGAGTPAATPGALPPPPPAAAAPGATSIPTGAAPSAAAPGVTAPQIISRQPAGGAPGVGAATRVGGAEGFVTSGASAAQKTAIEEQIKTAEGIPRANIDLSTKAAAEAGAAAKGAVQNIATADRIIRATETNPQFFDILRSDAYRTFYAAQTDSERRDALERMATSVNIPRAQRAEFRKLMGDIRQLELAGITSSGLSASQLNSEREAERAVAAVGVDIKDPAVTARSQALLARTRNEYLRAKAEYFGRADKRLNPAEIEANFDREIGQGIWDRANAEISRIIGGTTAPATGGITIIDRRPIR